MCSGCVGQAVHAGAALGQAGAVYALRALAETPIAYARIAVARAYASQLLAVASVA